MEKFSQFRESISHSPSQKEFEQALDNLVKKGKDKVSVNMIQTELYNLVKKTVDGAAVGELCKKYLKPTNGPANYFDPLTYKG